MVASRTSADKVPPLEQFTGRKIDAKIDLRIVYGDYVQAINPLKNNQVENANTHGCIAVRQTGSLTGSVQMWRSSTWSFVTRDQFTILPMLDEVIKMLDAMAEKDEITRSTNKFEKPNPGDSDNRDDNDRPPQLIEDDESDDEDDGNVGGPTMKVIPPDKRSEGVNDVDIEDVDEDDEDYLKDD